MVYFFVFISIIVVDQTTKKIISTKLKLNQSIEILKDKLYITHLRNKGAAYGLLANHPKILMVVSFLTLAKIMIAFKELLNTNERNTAYKISLVCILGGALGNILDRLRVKYVTDFIFFKFSKKAPVFNFADFSILIGAVIFIIKQICSEKK